MRLAFALFFLLPVLADDPPNVETAPASAATSGTASTRMRKDPAPADEKVAQLTLENAQLKKLLAAYQQRWIDCSILSVNQSVLELGKK